MAEQLYQFDEKTARILLDVARAWRKDSPSAGRQTPRLPAQPAAYVVHAIEVTSATADSYGYPARIQTFDGSTWSDTYEECRAVKIGGGTLTTGFYPPGRLMRVESNGMHVYGVYQGVSSVGSGPAYSVLNGTPAYTTAPEVIDATIREVLTLGVSNTKSGLLEFLDEFSARQVTMRAANLLASQHWTLPKSIPSTRQFFQAYGVSGGDVETKWVGLNLSTQSVAGLSAIASVSNWEQLRFNSAFFEFMDPGTGEYGIVTLKKTLSSSLLYCHSGDTEPTWNTLVAGTGVTITPDSMARTVTLAATGAWIGDAASDLLMHGFDICMDTGGGTGGGDILMDGGSIIFPSSASALVDGGGFDAAIPYSRNLIGSDGSSVSMHWTNSGIELGGKNVYMNAGAGSGGGDIYMDGGDIRCPSGTYLTDGVYNSISPYSRNLIGSDGSSVSMHWTNSGIELGGKNVYMNAGAGSGGGDIYMDGGDIRCPSGTYLTDATNNAICPYSRNLIGSDGSSISMHWTNNGIELGGKSIYMNAGAGSGGGDIYMDGGKIRFATGNIVDQAAARADSTAATVADLVTDFNDLLAKLRTAGIIHT